MNLKKVAVMMIVAGLVMAGCAFAFAGFNLDKLDSNAPYETVKKDFDPSGISSIALEDGVYKMTVKRSTDGQVHATMTCGRLEKYESEVVGGELRIRIVYTGKWYERLVSLSFGGRDTGITLEIPDSLVVPIRATTGTSTINMTGIGAKSLYVEVGTGSANLEGVTAEELDAHAGTGSVHLTQVNAGRLKAKTGTGSVKLTRVNADYVSATTGTGSVKLDGVDAKNLEFKTGTGGVSGTLAGKITDYTIESSTGTGGNSLPGSLAGGDRSLRAHTGTGSIDISFAS